MNRLSELTLERLPDVVRVPDYDRGKLTAGIVHFGIGGFHRAHQALVVDTLLADPAQQGWGIVGVGVREADRAMRDALVPQNGLYSLTEKGPEGHHTRIIGSILDFVYAPESPGRVLELLEEPATRIVSLTITEGGYNFNQVTGDFDWNNSAVASDVARIDNPQTVFGFIVHALARRRDAGSRPFTVMSCDNIQGNGDLAKRMVVSFAQRVNPGLAAWIDSEVAFPNSMVDRITPVTADDDRETAASLLGVVDAWPVVCEPFFQWVLEDHFPEGRPAFEDAGVQLVEDVEPYELMKLRLLNASHQALAYFGFLMGYRYVHDAVADPLINSLLRRYMRDEARSSLRPVPGVDLDEYCDTLIERFLNPDVADTVARLCAESSDRIPKWLVPVINERIDKGLASPLATAVVASWARYAEGVDESGAPINVVDNLAPKLMTIAQTQRHGDVLAFVRNPELFGELCEDEMFTSVYERTLRSLWEVGARQTLADLLELPAP